MADVIMNQHLLGIVDCVLNCLELLSNLKTRPSLLHHADDLAKMPSRALEPFGDLGMSFMLHVFLSYSRLEDSPYPEGGIAENA